MNSTSYKFFSIAGICAFAAYWVIIPLMTLPHVPGQKKLAAAFSLPHKLFVSKWRFFAPPVTYNGRIYIITRDKNNLRATDTIEVLHQLLLNKYNAVPFNQQEHILDHFTSFYFIDIMRRVSGTKKMLVKANPGMPDSMYKKKGNNCCTGGACYKARGHCVAQLLPAGTAATAKEHFSA